MRYSHSPYLNDLLTQHSSALVNFMSRPRFTESPVAQKTYSLIETFLQTAIQEGFEPGLQLHSSELVKFYISSWEAFSVGTKYNAGVLNYMTRHYVCRRRDEGHTNVYPMRQLHFLLWKAHVLDVITADLKKWLNGTGLAEKNADNLGGFKKCYIELREEVKGTTQAMATFEKFCRLD